MASAVRITTNRKIVSQPRNVISEPLPPQQRVQEIHANDRRSDQPEQVSAAHIASIPKISATSSANTTSAISTARTSMRSDWRARREGVIQMASLSIQEL